MIIIFLAPLRPVAIALLAIKSDKITLLLFSDTSHAFPAKAFPPFSGSNGAWCSAFDDNSPYARLHIIAS